MLFSACWLKIDSSGFGRCVSLSHSLSLTSVSSPTKTQSWLQPSGRVVEKVVRWRAAGRVFLNSKASKVLDSVMSGPSPWGVVSKHTDLFLSQIFWETGSFFLTLAKMNNKQEPSLQMTPVTSRRKIHGEPKALPLSNSFGLRETS